MLRAKCGWISKRIPAGVLTAGVLWFAAGTVDADELLVGSAMRSITPEEPVGLTGQRRVRIAEQVESPVTATALALESRRAGETVDQSIMVSCDLVAIREGILELVRARVKERLPELDVEKLFLSATHTHTAPVMIPGKYDLPDEGIMQPEQYREFLADRVTEAVVEAWEKRAPGSVAWGLGHAVVGKNRRITYQDGRAQMYGPTDRSDLLNIEGYEDHALDVLFFWNHENQLTATAINVACPAQEVEGRSAVNADFWHETRKLLRERYGEDLVVLGWTGAAGDQSPHLQFREKSEERMRKLRGLTRLEELARRIVAGWEEAYAGAKKDIRTNVVLKHQVQKIDLPKRKVTEQEYQQAKAEVAEFRKRPNDRRTSWSLGWHGKVVDRYEHPEENSTYTMELHVIRLGEIVIASNDFELFTDFGIRIKARSPALQTFLIQLAGPGSYVPTERAVKGGGYSAVVQSSVVGPQGGQVLVDRTVELINELWGKTSSE